MVFQSSVEKYPEAAWDFYYVSVLIRAGGWRGGPGADLCRDTGRKLPVDDEAKCRGGEHGKN